MRSHTHHPTTPTSLSPRSCAVAIGGDAGVVTGGGRGRRTSPSGLGRSGCCVAAGSDAEGGGRRGEGGGRVSATDANQADSESGKVRLALSGRGAPTLPALDGRMGRAVDSPPSERCNGGTVDGPSSGWGSPSADCPGFTSSPGGEPPAGCSACCGEGSGLCCS